MRIVLLTLLSAFLMAGCCSSRTTSSVPDNFDDAHRIERVDVQRLLAGDMRYNIEIRDGDVLIPSNDELFTDRVDPDGLLVPNRVMPDHRPLLPHYAIKPGDLLSVTIYELRTPGVDDIQQCRVDGYGWIRVAKVGPFHAAGSSTSELEQSIAKRLEAAIILREPTVSVHILESQRAYTVQFPTAPSPRSVPLKIKQHRLLQTFSRQDMQGIETYRYVYVVRKQSEQD